MTKSDITPYPLRMPAPLRAHLEARAKEHGRSTNSEIISILTGALEDRPATPDAAPASAISALAYRITWLEAELLARRSDLAQYADVMSSLVAAIPLEVHDEPKTRAAIKTAIKAAKRFRRTDDESAAAEAEHSAKLNQLAALMREVHGIPGDPKA